MRRRGCVAAGYHGAGAVSRTSIGPSKPSGAPASSSEFAYRGRARSRRQARFPAPARCAVGAGHLRRAEGHVPASRRWPAACRSCSRAAARSPRWSRRPAAACWSTPDDPESLAEGLFALWSDRTAAAGARRSARSPACASTTPIERSADRLLDAFEFGSRPRRAGVSGLAMLEVSRASARITRRRAGRCRCSPTCQFSLRPGDAAAITGPSGSGKSSLLYMLGRARAADARHGHARRPESVRARRRPALADFRNRAHRLRVPGSLPAAAVLGARERAGADAGRGARRARRRSRCLSARGR